MRSRACRAGTALVHRAQAARVQSTGSSGRRRLVPRDPASSKAPHASRGSTAATRNMSPQSSQPLQAGSDPAPRRTWPRRRRIGTPGTYPAPPPLATQLWAVAVNRGSLHLARIVRINLRRSLRAFFDGLFSNRVFQPFRPDARTGVCHRRSALTRDPFDSLIAAAARDLGLAVDNARYRHHRAQAPSRRSSNRWFRARRRSAGRRLRTPVVSADAAYP